LVNLKSVTVIGKKFADKNFRGNNIGGTKMPEFLSQKGILVPPILFPLRSANLFVRKYFELYGTNLKSLTKFKKS
jgi:hypothetical protein